RASADVDATPATSSPWRSRSREAASRKCVESSTSRQRIAIANRMPDKTGRVLAGSRNIPSEIWRGCRQDRLFQEDGGRIAYVRPLPTGGCRGPSLRRGLL